MAAGERPLAYRAYHALGRALEPLAPLLIRRRLRQGKEHADRWPERLGRASLKRPPGRLVWIHAASVGETNAALPLIAALRERLPAEILVTTGTVTSASLAASRLQPGTRHQFVPLDLPRAVGRFLDHWRPDLAILVESELWPGIVFATGERSIPIALVNGKLSEPSFRRWRKIRGAAQAVFARISAIAAQSVDDAKRFALLGAPLVTTTGNLKFDGPPLPADGPALAELRQALDGRPVFGAASTHAGEEAAILETHAALASHLPRLVTLLAPRHPSRADEVHALAGERGLSAARRSLGETATADTEIILFDTIGELGLLYRLAPVAFVGRSLAGRGGQNPLEAAKLGSAVLHGPHVENFRDIYGMLDDEEAAVLVRDEGELAQAAERLILNPARARALAERARTVVARSEGAVARTMQALDPLLAPLRQ